MFGFLQVWINKQIKTINYEIYKYKEIINKIHGGGLINFPTRFLRWIKIDGDAEGDDGGGSGGGDGGGDSTPTETYIKFRADDFGIRNQDNVPDTVDRNKGYTLDEIFDISGNVLEEFIKAQEDTRDALVSNGYSLGSLEQLIGIYYPDEPQFPLFNYCSYESGEIGRLDGSYPLITIGLLKWENNQYTTKTFIEIEGTNLKSYTWTPPAIVFEKNDEDGKWYIVYAR